MFERFTLLFEEKLRPKQDPQNKTTTTMTTSSNKSNRRENPGKSRNGLNTIYGHTVQL